ncbi:carbamoyltransferase C-terminal domain-containing protein [Piscinibacter gummiphilus]|uniref:Carbamoyltransferase C-terminal domain-containing protein n=1 Tax=Piscinibacter gummiphilus TaxID=946333 RepID=A0ABZ0D750_9BURK|nr:carbamoyltransferase C-terminal domain-containing protein [Piscinibacter gummiphilus]WOB11351.1 carbamoyltransferase C-terminal domain-containing protein [Piscinibacter gummiphilus]
MNGTLKHGGFNGEVVVVAFGAQVHAHKEAAARRTSIKKPLTIVGISASHDASACVLRDGKLVRAIQLERLTRVKHDGQVFLHSSLAVDYCLSSLGLRERDVDFFAFNCMPLSPGVTGLGLPSHDDGFRLFDPFGDRAVFVSHHLSHALGAFHGSPFETATVIVADGSGGTTVGKPDLLLSGPELLDYLSTPSHHLEPLHVQSVYRFGGNGWTLVDREYSDVFNPISGVSRLGEAYATISGYVFGDWQASGKVMGLAPYGDPERFGGTLLIRDEHGRLQFGNHWRNQHRRVLKRGAPMEYRDLAARVQRDLETALIDRFRSAIAKTKCGDVAYAGGIALNSVANQRLRTETGATGLYVMPSCHDAGISIGAAVGAHKFATGELSPNSIATDAFGHPYSRRDIAAAIAQSDGLVQKQVVGLEDIVDLLAARKIVGWFDGGSEFGPRSLGQRSLLAAPTDRDMWTYINRRIKFREDFRPFAPMVPEEVASEYFEIDEPSPFMLRVVRVRDRYRQMLGAITHVDGTARVQTVRRDVLPKLHELLHRVGARLGVPVLVNTSFNVRGEPLVETPGQAIEMLMATHLDAVVFNGDTLVQPYSMPTKALTPELVLQLPPKCRLDVRITHSERRYLLVPEARGSDAAVELPEWAYQLISQLDGERSVSTFIDALSADLRPAAHRLLESLVALRLLAIKGGVPQGSANGLSTLPLPPAIHPLTGTAVDDPTPLVAGTQRTEYLAQTISRVKSKLAVMQVGRVADVSDYDHLRIPVISCIRPFVSEEDITCTQGKGVDLDHALASALMETVERYSAWHHRHLRTRIATPAELSRSSEPFLPISRLGGRDVETGAFEWVWAQGLNGTRPRWVPAAAVFSPYEPPSGVTAPLSWCTTGLSAGNTLHEAIAHGLLEVVERNALSRYQVGHPGRLLDVSSLPEGPERDLFARFSQAGIEFFVVAFDEISALPAFSVSLYEPEGPEPRIPVSGQGCNPSPRIALQRAALEAAQSRVVAIQGSREDLVRHGSDWIADQAARSAHWQRAREAASRNGTVQLPKEPISPRTVGELIAQVVTPLRLQGFEEVLYVDLTNPRVGIPVACVIIPGMYDIDTIPESRSSNYREFA